MKLVFPEIIKNLKALFEIHSVTHLDKTEKHILQIFKEMFIRFSRHVHLNNSLMFELFISLCLCRFIR